MSVLCVPGAISSGDKKASLMKTRVAAKGGDDASDDDFNLDVILGKVELKSVGKKGAATTVKAEAGAEMPAAKRSKGAGGRGGGAAMRTSSMQADLTPMSKANAKAQKEKNTAEQIILSAKQALSTIGSDQLISSASGKTVQSVLVKLSTALSQDKLKILLDSTIPDVTDVVSDLKQQQKFLLQVGEVFFIQHDRLTTMPPFVHKYKHSSFLVFGRDYFAWCAHGTCIDLNCLTACVGTHCLGQPHAQHMLHTPFLTNNVQGTLF
jgi:hypothetical protein